jgi:two-component system, response regulator / RNA-binding antiterminator
MVNVLLLADEADHRLGEAFNTSQLKLLKAAYSPAFLALAMESKPDVIMFILDSPSQNLLDDLYTLDQQYPLPVIMFASDGRAEIINKVIKAEVSAYIVNGLDAERIPAIIHTAIARFNQRQQLKDALYEARSQLEDRKQIDRAKAILIKTQKFTEDKAYHTLRKLAMDRNITLGEMARNVIAMAELLK